MKKLLAIVLALVMVLGIAATAGAVSWVNPGTSGSASPFKIEVIKLGVNADVTGAKYYTVLTDAAVFSQSTLYYAVKLTVPSVSDLNNYYGNSKFRVGDQVKVTMTYTNIVNKSTQVIWVTLGGNAKTLWLNQNNTFDETWTATLNCNAGCGNNHILSAIASDTTKASIRACIGATGNLKDIKIDGCYSVVEKNYYGIKPCKRCSYTDLSGFLFQGDCAAFDIFFSTASNGKVTGIYAIDKCYKADDFYAGTMKQLNQTLYGWVWNGFWPSCGSTNGCAEERNYVLTPLNWDVQITPAATNWTWNSPLTATDQPWLSFVRYKGADKNWTLTKENVTNPDFNAVYYEKDNRFVKVTTGCESWATAYGWAKDSHGSMTGALNPNAPGVVIGGQTISLGSYYPYVPPTGGGQIVPFVYGDAYRYAAQSTDATGGPATSDATLYKMTSATTVECDGNEGAYLSAINHMLALLGFTYADVAAGNIYMTKDNLLTNFGFATGAICDTKEWGAYTAAITVAPIAEVPATGSMTYMGFAMIALAIAAAVVTRKVRA